MSTEASLYLVATIVLISVTCKMMHYQLISAQALLREQINEYQKINVICELQHDLLLPAKIIPINSHSHGMIGLKIMRKNQKTIYWQFNPNVQRGINGSWTKLFKGQIKYKFINHQLMIEIIDENINN